MRKVRPIRCFLVLLVLLVSCTSTKNTSGTRWYHSFNTRYNVYFNGKQAYDQAWKSQLESHQDNFTEMIYMYPVSALPKDKQTTGGSFDLPIEKSVKAIKQHSIQSKPAKKQGRRNDPKYQEFMSRTEYNPFLHNAWMLMAKSQFHNGDFLEAASSFSYIARLYSSQPEIATEAKIWHARAYAELDWYYEAGDKLAKIDSVTLNKHKDLKNLWTSAKADLLVKEKEYESAVPYLQGAIKSEKNKLQKEREKYLLGQVYTSLGENDLAYKTFGQISSARAPYVLEFSAKIRQTEVYPGGNTIKAIKDLQKMTKSVKNKDYLDQVYYAMGNIYMTEPDTVKAVESYELGVEKSTRHGIDKALNQIKLGDIYFQQRDYVKAQPNYSEALGQLKKGDEAYPRVSKRSEVLDELLIYHEAVVLQDSLLRLSEMTEEEQLAIVNKIIEELKKKEEEERKKAERDEFLAEQEANRAASRPSMGTGGVVAPPQEAGAFYFYSPQLVAAGKNDFQQKWGRRKLEDNWRRRDKSSQLFDSDLGDELTEEDLAGLPEDELPEGAEEGAEGMPEEPAIELSTDPYDPEYYLQQIPKTEEEKQAAHLIIADGLYNMGVIYKDKLEDFDLALETFDTLDTRYPQNEHKLEAYYHTYMIYFRLGNMEMANLYKQKIRAEFPESKYAIAMADPDYEYNLKMMYVVQDSLYQASYDAYLVGDVNTMRDNYTLVKEKYPQSKLMPKFIFLNALSYVQTGDANLFKEGLKELIDNYSEEDVSVLAAEMMKGFQRGLTLSGDGMIARGSIFSLRFGGLEDIALDPSELEFSEEANGPHELLLIYPKGALNDNLLLYTVASYNFGHFQVNDFDLAKLEFDLVNMLEIKTFNNLAEVIQYIGMINKPDGYAMSLGLDVITLPISIENYNILMKGKSLDEYMNFFAEHFGEGNESIVDKWDLAQEEETEEAFDEVEERIEEVVTAPVPFEEDAEDDVRAYDIRPEEEDVAEIIEEEQEEIIIEQPPIVIEEEFPIVIEEDTPIVVEGEQPVEVDAWGDAWEDAEEWKEDDGGSDNIFKRLGKMLQDKVSPVLDEFDSNDDTQQEEEDEESKSTGNPLLDYVKEQERLDKEREEIEKEEQKQAEKDAKTLKKQKEKDAKELKKQKEKERKERKEREKARKDEQKRKAKEREDARKLKEKERKEQQKIKEQERKAREKAREEERKRKERERKEAQKQREAERKANQKK